MKLNPYLTFGGNCEEALNFYKKCFGGEFVGVNRFKEGPPEMGGMKVPDELMEKIMHMTWRFGDNVVMASDSFGKAPEGGNITLSMSIDDPDKMEKIFNELSAGGRVTMPLEDTFWGARFGMFTDRFGIKWMFNCQISE